MNLASIRNAITVAAIVAMGAFALFHIGGATAQSGCIEPVTADGDYSGSWTSDCLSENTPSEPTNPPTGTRYARFYTFTLAAPADITIDLTSTADTYMYLMEGASKNGAVLHENDDAESGNSNSRIQASLQPRDYTIEATTYEVETTGDFSLTVSGLPDAPTPTATLESDPKTSTPLPTATMEPSPTPAPTQSPVPDNVLSRLTTLETAVATQQELLNTLDAEITAVGGRVSALESDALTPEPTATPGPAPEPTATPTPGNLGTRSNPVPLGQAFRPPSSPWELRIMSVDWDAWPEIQVENLFNDPPDSGHRYVLITIEARNNGSEASTFSAFFLNSVGDSNIENSTSFECGVIPNRFGSITRIFPGGVLQGNICTEVSISDTSSLLLFGDYYGFDMTDGTHRDTLWFWNLR